MANGPSSGRRLAAPSALSRDAARATARLRANVPLAVADVVGESGSR